MQARTDPAEIPPCELGIVATKSEFTAAAMDRARGVFADAAVASVQNGLGNEEIVAQFVPRVIRGSILPAGAIVAPGVVRYDAPGETWLGPFEPQPAAMVEVELLARLLTEGGLPTQALADARGPQWGKVVFNAATSPIAALTGLTIGQIGEDPALRDVVAGLAQEAENVCAATGIELPAPTMDVLDDAVEHAYAHKPSMLQDVLAHRRTEVDVLNGGIAAAGRAAGVATPLTTRWSPSSAASNAPGLTADPPRKGLRGGRGVRRVGG